MYGLNIADVECAKRSDLYVDEGDAEGKSQFFKVGCAAPKQCAKLSGLPWAEECSPKVLKLQHT